MSHPTTPAPLADRNDAAAQTGFTVALGLAAVLELLVTWQVRRDANAVNYHLLAFCAVFCILDEHRPFPKIQFSLAATLAGSLLLISALVKARWMVNTDNYQHCLALALATGIGIAALGWREVGRMWKVGVILALLSAADTRFQSYGLACLNLNAIGATLSANLLFLAVYPAVPQGDFVSMPGGEVEVYGPCSSVIPLNYLLKLALLALLVFRSRWWQRIAIVTLTVPVALGFNAIRIAVMAVLNASGDRVRFDYGTTGAVRRFSPLGTWPLSARCARLACIGEQARVRLTRRFARRPSWLLRPDDRPFLNLGARGGRLDDVRHPRGGSILLDPGADAVNAPRVHVADHLGVGRRWHPGGGGHGFARSGWNAPARELAVSLPAAR